MAFDISTVTFKGSELFAAATAADKLIVSGCDAFVAPYTLAQAQAVTTRVSSPMTTSSDVTLVGSGDNHIMLRAIFEAGITSGGLAKTLMIFGHKQSDPSNDFVLCVVSSNDGFNLPLTTDAISTFETLFDVEYVVPGDSVATATTAVFATLAEFNDLKSRAVLCHNYGDNTHGPDQNIYGYKSFYGKVAVHDEFDMYSDEEDENESCRVNGELLCWTPVGAPSPVYEYWLQLIGEHGSYARVVFESRNHLEGNYNEDDSGVVTLNGHRCNFNTDFVTVEGHLNANRTIKFKTNEHNIFTRLYLNDANNEGEFKITNFSGSTASNSLTIGDDGTNDTFIELSSEDIRFTKIASSAKPDSELKFSIGPFNTETFGYIRLYNRDTTARRAYGTQYMRNSFNGRYIRYAMELNDSETDETYGYVSIHHLDTHEKAFVYISGESLYARCNTIYPSDIEGVDTSIGSSLRPFKWAYIERISSTAVIAESLEPDEIQNELGLSIKWGESGNGFMKMESIDSTSDKLTIAANKIMLSAENGTSYNGIDIDSRFTVDAHGFIDNSDGGMYSGELQADTFSVHDEITISGLIDSNLIPKTNNSRDLGSSSKKWATIYGNGIECDAITCNDVYGDLHGLIPHSGDGSSSVLLKAGTIGLFFISNSVLGGDQVFKPGYATSFSNAGNNKIFFAVNRTFTVSNVVVTAFERDTSTTISANTVHLRLLSAVYGSTQNGYNLALCMVTADQG